MEDVLCHWWVNLGHSHMPNGQPYSPDKYGLVTSRTLPSSRRYSTSTSFAVIDHRNRDSAFLDSDVEHDFRSYQESARTLLQDSEDKAVPLSKDNRPDVNTSESYIRERKDINERSSHSRSLSAMSPHVLSSLHCKNISPSAEDKSAHEVTKGNNKNNSKDVCQNTEEQNEEENTKQGEPSPVVFDSERKPKRGILKRKGKFSGGDSGCIIPDDMCTRDNLEPRSDLHSRRLSTPEDGSCVVLDEEHRATHTAGSATFACDRHSCCLTKPFPSTKSFITQPRPRVLHSVTPQNLQSCSSVHKCHSETISTDRSYVATHNTNVLSGQDCELAKGEHFPEDTVKSTPKYYLEYQVLIDSVRSPSRPKGILKYSKSPAQKADMKRSSISSLESDSSVDVLDLSYDSGDSGHSMSQESQPSSSLSVRGKDYTGLYKFR